MRKRHFVVFLLAMTSFCMLTGFKGKTYRIGVVVQDAAEEVSEEQNLSDFSMAVERYEGIEKTLQTMGDYAYELSDEELNTLWEVAIKEDEYAKLALCKATGYVNIRSIPSTEGEIVGKIYHGAVAEILENAGEEGDWFKITSGTVEGYIKSDYFISGEEAVDAIDDYVTRYVQIQATRLNVRSKPAIESDCIGYLDLNEKVVLLENLGEWMRIKYNNGEEGYVASEYVTVSEEFQYAISIEEERKEQERLKELEARKKASQKTTEIVEQPAPPLNANYASVGDLRNAIVEYAVQFVGNKYKSGGNSLTTGTDCSGFTSLIMAQFGYALSRTPSGQYSSNGRSVDLSNAQKGDIICYGSSGKCTHVAIYMGDGKIVHAANSRRGITISDVGMETIIGVKNVLD